MGLKRTTEYEIESVSGNDLVLGLDFDDDEIWIAQSSNVENKTYLDSKGIVSLERALLMITEDLRDGESVT